MRTEVAIEKSESPFDYSQKLIFMGSCFSEHIGGKLEERKFNIDLNPFGILYNPVSIASGIQHLINQKSFEEEDLFFHQGWWHSFDHHSIFSNANKQVCLENINRQLQSSALFLREADYLFITFGTARVYIKKNDGRVVSNCHQVPATLFDNELLRVGDIVRMFTLLIQEVSAVNNNLKWVFTVSPVRHWKDGPIGNQVSKSTLLLAVNELKNKFDNIDYFPAYEIFMDDLRDYRFYADDLLHPGSQGVDYTWKKFIETYISDKAKEKMKTVEAFSRAMNHRPRNAGSSDHKEFIKKQYQAVTDFSKLNPEIMLEEFITYFSPEGS